MVLYEILKLSEAYCFNQQYSSEDSAVSHLLYLFILYLIKRRGLNEGRREGHTSPPL